MTNRKDETSKTLTSKRTRERKSKLYQIDKSEVRARQQKLNMSDADLTAGDDALDPRSVEKVKKGHFCSMMLLHKLSRKLRIPAPDLVTESFKDVIQEATQSEHIISHDQLDIFHPPSPSWCEVANFDDCDLDRRKYQVGPDNATYLELNEDNKLPFEQVVPDGSDRIHGVARREAGVLALRADANTLRSVSDDNNSPFGNLLESAFFLPTVEYPRSVFPWDTTLPTHDNLTKYRNCEPLIIDKGVNDFGPSVPTILGELVPLVSGDVASTGAKPASQYLKDFSRNSRIGELVDDLEKCRLSLYSCRIDSLVGHLVWNIFDEDNESIEAAINNAKEKPPVAFFDYWSKPLLILAPSEVPAIEVRWIQYGLVETSWRGEAHET